MCQLYFSRPLTHSMSAKRGKYRTETIERSLPRTTFQRKRQSPLFRLDLLSFTRAPCSQQQILYLGVSPTLLMLSNCGPGIFRGGGCCSMACVHGQRKARMVGTGIVVSPSCASARRPAPRLLLIPPPGMCACPRRMYSYRFPLYNNNTSIEPILDLEITYSTS